MVADMGPGELTSITVTLSVYDPEDSSDSGGAEVMETWESNGPFTRLFNFDTATTTVSSGSPVFTVPVGTASMFLYEATDAAGNIGTAVYIAKLHTIQVVNLHVQCTVSYSLLMTFLQARARQP
eukprot:SAG31_NODE_2442_length_5683_cov_8.114792_6_plen_124_part_00